MEGLESTNTNQAETETSGAEVAVRWRGNTESGGNMKRVVGETVITEEATKMNTTDVEREDPTTAEEEIGTDPTREEETGIERDPLRQSDIRRDHTEVEVEKKTDIRTVDDERGGIGSLRLNEEEDLI